MIRRAVGQCYRKFCYRRLETKTERYQLIGWHPSVGNGVSIDYETRNVATMRCNPSAWRLSCSAALADCSTPAAFCLVTLAIASTLRAICSLAADCSVLAEAICWIMSCTR